MQVYICMDAFEHDILVYLIFMLNQKCMEKKNLGQRPKNREQKKI